MTKKINFEMQKTETQQRLDKLRAQQAALSLDALKDEAKRPKLEKVEADLADAERDLQRIEMADAEHERQQEETAAQKADKARSRALDVACGLQVQREDAARAVDETALAFTQAVAAWGALANDQVIHLNEAGRDQGAAAARPRGFFVEAALKFAMSDTEPPLQSLGVLEALPMMPPSHIVPLAESDPQAVERKGDVGGGRSAAALGRTKS